MRARCRASLPQHSLDSSRFLWRSSGCRRGCGSSGGSGNGRLVLQLAVFSTSRCRERVEMSFNLTMYQPHLQGERPRLGILGRQSWPPSAASNWVL